MGDIRYAPFYARIRDAPDPLAEIRAMSDEDVIAALAAASVEKDPYWANVLATEAQNRARQNGVITRTLGEGVCAVDSAGRLTFLNPAAEAMLGWAPGELVGRDAFQSLLPPPEVPGARDASPLRTVLAEGATARAEDQLFVRKDGSRFPVAFTASPVIREDEVAGVVLVFRDVTDRKHSERLVARRLEFEKTIAAISSRFVGPRDLDDAILGSLEDMGRLTGAGRAYLFLVRGGGTLMDNTHEWCAEGVAPQRDRLQNLPCDATPWWMARLRRGEAIHVPDVAALPPEAAAERALLESQGIRSVIAFPVHEGGRLAGFIGFDDVDAPDGWPDDDLALLGLAARTIGNALDRQRARAVLAGQARVLERIATGHTLEGALVETARLVEGNADGLLASVHLLAPDGRRLLHVAAPSLPDDLREALHGLPVGPSATTSGAAAHRREAVVSPDVANDPLWDSHRDHARRHGLGAAWATPLLSSQGALLGTFTVYYREPRLPSTPDRRLVEAATHLAGIAIERKHVEDSRAELLVREREARATAENAAKRLRDLQAVTDVALAHLSLSDLLREILGRLREVLAVDAVAVLLRDANDNTLVLRASIGLPPDASAGQRVAIGQGFAGRVAAERRPRILEDVERNPDLAAEWSLGGFRSLLGAPLLADGRVTGVLKVASARPRAFGTEDVRLLELAAERLATAIEHARLYEAERAARTEAEAAQRRLALLAEASRVLSASLDYSITLSNVARLAVSILSDWCLVDMVEDETQVRRVEVACAHAKHESLAAELRRIHPPRLDAATSPVARVLRTGRAEIVSAPAGGEWGLAEAGTDRLDAVRRVGIRSLLVVPLVARGRTLGALSLVSAESGRDYGPSDLAFADDLARRAALAIDNARLYKEQYAARADAQASERRAAFVAEASRTLSSSPDHEAALRALARLAAPVLGDWCAVHLADDAGNMTPLAVASADPAKAASAIDLAGHAPVPRDAFLGTREGASLARPQIHSDMPGPALRAMALDARLHDAVESLGSASSITVPLSARGRVLGAITVACAAGGRRLGPSDLTLVEEVARRASIAVDRALLLKEAEAARAASESAERRAAFLAEASTVLASSLDYELTLGNVASLSVPMLADWCAAFVSDGDGGLRRIAAAADDEDVARALDELQDRERLRPHPDRGVERVIRTGEPEFYASVSEEMLAQDGGNEERQERLRRIAPRSVIIVPLNVREQTLGAMVFGRSTGPEYTPDDLALAAEVARRAGVAVENTRLYAAEQDARQAAESAATRVARLQAVTAALSEASTPGDVASVVVDEGRAALGATAGSVVLLVPERGELEIVRAMGYEWNVIEAFRRFPLDASLPLAAAARTGELVLLESLEERQARFPEIDARLKLPSDGAWAAIPLTLEGRVIGGIGLTFPSAREFTPADKGFMLALARQAAQAIERARLFDAERRARSEAEHAVRARDESIVLMDTLLASSPVGFAFTDRELKYVRVNAAFAELNGRPAEDHIGRTISEVLPDLGAAVETVVRRVIETGAPVRNMALSGESPSSSGVERHWLASYYPVRGRGGDILGVGAVVADVTERRRAEESVRDREERYRLVARAVSDVIWDWDLTTDELWWNESFSSTFGYADGDVEPTIEAWTRFIHPEDAERVERGTRDVIDGGGAAWRDEYRFRRKDGSYAYVLDRGHVMRDDAGRPVRMIGSMIDVTERRRAEDALRESEDRLNRVVNTLAEGIAIIDGGGRLTFVNAAGARILGRGPEDLVGISHDDPAWRRAHADGTPLDGFESPVARVTATGEPEHGIELAVERPDGQRVLLSVSVGPLPSADGGPPGVIVSFSDVTERRRAEEALARSEESYRALVDLSPTPMAVHRNGVVLYMNPAAAQLVGADDARSLLGQSVLKFLHPDYHDAVKERMRIMMTERRPVPVITEKIVRLDGRVLDVEVAAMPVTYEGELAVQLIMRDVTASRRAEAEVMRLNRELELRVRERTRELAAANRELEAFSYSVSHDLRAPLRAIDYLSQALLEEYRDALDEDALDYLRRLRGESRRLTSLVNDLLTLSRVTREALRVAPVDVSALAREVVDDLRKADRERRAEIVIADDLTAEADPRLLRIVLENLLGNAWKFTSRRDEARIELGVEERDGEHVIFVRDDGAGFDPAKADHLFQPFRRLHSQSEFEGTGIGLATVRRIVERHGGRVWAESAPGEGATFRFTLRGVSLP